ncbi:hypothetical protein NUU61_001361 [Penicillium alfredii]|uniref:Uncharacterized protein n=1 Tax=Penicillium alfredii TaxID=1506179 RepID=A0A9W9G3Z5_9EURO|nr:uncharacterized protein NUU61_001361 [Penicillium alfredii]KAJ5111731.1 hypothetical protein NUU61_001361 [Penicillium alfredii]
MESHPDEIRGSSAAPSPEHLDGRSPSAYDFSVLFQLGTKANPIVIDDTPLPDPISDVIASNIDRDLRSDADTEIVSSPEFWDAFFDERSSSQTRHILPRSRSLRKAIHQHAVTQRHFKMLEIQPHLEWMTKEEWQRALMSRIIALAG